MTAIDIAGRSSIADWMVIASGTSARHVASMAGHIVEKLKAIGIKPRDEGLPQADWVAVDGGDVVVHLFRPEVRSFYDLEGMWKLPESKPAKAKAATPKKEAAPARKPAAKKAAAQARKPAAAKKPTPAKKPVTVKKPAAAKKPAPAKKPVAAKKPAAAKKAAPAKKPAAKKPTARIPAPKKKG